MCLGLCRRLFGRCFSPRRLQRMLLGRLLGVLATLSGNHEVEMGLGRGRLPGCRCRSWVLIERYGSGKMSRRGKMSRELVMIAREAALLLGPKWVGVNSSNRSLLT